MVVAIVRNILQSRRRHSKDKFDVVREYFVYTLRFVSRACPLQDDTVSKNLERLDTAQDLVDDNPAIYDEAASSLAGVLESELASTPVFDIVHPVSMVPHAVNALAATHPILQAAAIPFKLVLEVELEREHNDSRIPALLLCMADMILRNRQSGSKSEDKENPAKTPLETTLRSIAKSLRECGRDLEAYRRQKTIVKFFKAILQGYATTFSAHKQALIVSLGVDTFNKVAQNYALSVDTKDVVDKIFCMLTANEQKFTNISALKEKSDHKERVEAIVKDPGLWDKLKKIASEEDARSGAAAAYSKGVILPPKGDKPVRTLAENAEHQEQIEIVVALKQELKGLLLADQTVFMQKWEAREKVEVEHYEQMRKKLEDIQMKLQEAQVNIIKSVKDGPWTQINDPIIQEVWELAGWRSHYADRTAPIASHQNTDSKTASQSQSASSSEVSESDRWCLEFLKTEYMSALAQAIDLDGSGFIRIKEINDFVDHKPDGWSTLQWIAYTVAGHMIEVQIYRLRIMDLLKRMISMPDVKGINAILVQDYIVNHLTSFLQILGQNAAEISLFLYDNSNLCKLVMDCMKSREKTLAASLDVWRYEIHDTDMLFLISQTAGRKETLEQFILPVLLLVLSRHLSIMKLAKTHILHGNELILAGSTISVIVRAWANRVADLNKLFSAQPFNDLKKRFTRYAGGMFLPVYLINCKHGDSSVDDSSLSNEFTVPGIIWNKVWVQPEPSVNMLSYPHYTLPMEVATEEERKYVEILMKIIRYRHYKTEESAFFDRWSAAFDILFAEDQSKRLWPIADLQVRQQQIHRFWSCDGCNPQHFDLCQNCETAAFVDHTHLRSHNMFRLPWPMSGSTVKHLIKKAWQRFENIDDWSDQIDNVAEEDETSEPSTEEIREAKDAEDSEEKAGNDPNTAQGTQPILDESKDEEFTFLHDATDEHCPISPESLGPSQSEKATTNDTARMLGNSSSGEAVKESLASVDRGYSSYDLCEMCAHTDQVGKGVHKKHAFLKVPFPLIWGARHKYVAQAHGLIENARAAPQKSMRNNIQSPETQTDSEDGHDHDDTSDTASEDSAKIEEEDEMMDRIASKQSVVAELPDDSPSLLCNNDDEHSMTEGYFRCLDCPYHILCVVCERNNPPKGSAHLTEHVLLWVRKPESKKEDTDHEKPSQESRDEKEHSKEGIQGVEKRLQEMERRHAESMKDLSTRLTNMEALLSRIAERSGLQ
ncbi:hypothetical protein SISNIDRAFT_482656 [Sistotremastrum niveocremeum HHB9708]|uniref:EF-hand domain-containing protein n=1 Tax=Sistotremastrum niveocremeum HHB9708 TaxID=1314777 RepID=A0A164YG04_9AGAM|nr:hypothetical protein SISNIDRAFT_482656 [Sistotremastrum niveocremeum HHB9708]